MLQKLGTIGTCLKEMATANRKIGSAFVDWVGDVYSTSMHMIAQLVSVACGIVCV